ncbi:MAG: Ig domain-containing protein, partial [Lachnospiraceae bacterium]|nr:Ig domain-containing protein [Lachnospiraceae bacterium]
VIVSERMTPVVDVSGVTLTPETLSMVVGETEPLTATVMPANATNKNVSYTSSDPSVATVDANGVVTAVSPGNTTVTVTTADGNKTDTCLVTVTAAPTPVSDVSLNHDTLSMTVGDTETLTATVRPTNATNKNVTYASSDPAVATVDANGVVTALSPGTTTITVTTQDGNKTDTCLVTVAPAQNGQLLTVIDRRTDAEHTDKTAAAVTSLTEPLTLTITTTDGTALRSALPAEDEIDQVSTFRLNMTNASGNPASSYGNCTVIMPLPMNFITDSGKLKLYYTNANGVLETIENISVSTSPDGVRTISFLAPEMTEYALVHSKKEATPVNPDDGDGNNPPENNDPVQPVVNVNVPTPEVTVNVPPPEVTVNVPAPQVTVNVPDASGNPSGTTVNTQGTTTNSTPSGTAAGISGTGAATSVNAGDMPRTGYHSPYRMIIVILLFISGLILVILSIEPKRRSLPSAS